MSEDTQPTAVPLLLGSLNGNIISDWKSDGKTKLIDQIDSMISDRETKPEELEKLLLEFLEVYAEHPIIGEAQAVEVLRHGCTAASKTASPVSLADILVLADCHARSMDKSIPLKDGVKRSERVLKLIDKLRVGGLVPSIQLADRFSHDLDSFATSLGIKLQLARSMYVRTNTRANLAQVRYNTIREEADGFNKLILLLSPPFLLRYPSLLASRILAITGAFELDSHRVLDIVLDCLEHVPFASSETDKSVTDLLVDLLRHHGPSQSLLSLMAFKFATYSLASSSSEGSTESQVGPEGLAPRGLFNVAAVLIKANLITLEGLLPHLSPPDETMFTQTREWERRSEEAVEKGSKKALEELKQVSLDKIFETNQKLRLLESLMRLEDWERAMSLLERWNGVRPCRFPVIAKLLSRRLQATLEPLYKPYSPRMFLSSGGEKPIMPEHDVARLREQIISPILRFLGPYIAYDTTLLYKFVRTLSALAPKPHRDGSPAVGPLDDLVEAVSVRVLLPAVSLIPVSPVASSEVWSYLKNYKYSLRYRIYFESRKSADIDVNLRCASQIQEIRAILRRVTMDKVKEDGRKIGRLALSTPRVVFQQVLLQLQSYSNFIDPMADALKFLTPLGADVLAYLLIEALSRPEDLVKADGQNSAHWLTGLASFCGGFYRRYGFRLDLEPILVYVQNQLRRNSPWHLLVFKQLLSKMANIDVQEEAYDDQLIALNSAPSIRDLVRQDGVMQQGYSSRSAIYALAQSLRECKLPLHLYSLIARVRQAAAYTLDTESQLRVVADLTDRCHQVLLQYSDFLRRHVILLAGPSVSHTEFEKRVANWFPADMFSILCGTSGSEVVPSPVPLPIAFHLVRPVLPLMFDEVRCGPQYISRNDFPKFKAASTKMRSSIPLADAVAEFIPRDLPFSSSLFVKFWSLSLYDITCADEVYQKQLSTASATEKTKINEQLAAHQAHVGDIDGDLRVDMESWFPSENSELAFITHCLIPRIRLSAEDAIFSGRWFLLLNKLQPKNWSGLRALRALFRLLRTVLAGSTENEAHRLGRALKVIWNEVTNVWKISEDSFKNNGCEATLGISYSEFRRETVGWEEHIRTVLVRLLLSSEKTDARNALLLLSRIGSVFPTYQHVLSLLSPRLEKMAQSREDEKKDLALLATNILHLLLIRTNLLSDSIFIADRPEVVAAPEAAPDAEPDENATADSDLIDADGAVTFDDVMNDAQPLDSQLAPEEIPIEDEDGEDQDDEAIDRVTRKRAREDEIEADSAVDTDRPSKLQKLEDSPADEAPTEPISLDAPLPE